MSFSTFVQMFRSAVSGNKPITGTRLVGEPWVNMADKQFGFIDAATVAQDLLPVRYFSSSAAFATGELALYSGFLYRANINVTPGVFNPLQWDMMISVAGATMTGALILAADPVVALGAATKEYADKMVPLAGGVMTGLLTLSANPSAVLGAATKGYVDTAVAPLATVAYVDAQILSAALGIGDIKVSAVSAIPAGWLQCDGASYATALYPLLFAKIAYTYGGAGANFNVPSAQDKVIVGAGGTYALGVTGGAATVALDLNTLPAHTHGISQTAHTHVDPGHTHTQDAHHHTVAAQTNAGGASAAPGVGWSFNNNVDTTDTVATNQANTTGLHSANANVSVLSNGSGLAHNNMQPYIAMNVLIRAA